MCVNHVCVPNPDFPQPSTAAVNEASTVISTTSVASAGTNFAISLLHFFDRAKTKFRGTHFFKGFFDCQMAFVVLVFTPLH